MSSEEPAFLDVDDVLEVHAMQFELFGGGRESEQRFVEDESFAVSDRGRLRLFPRWERVSLTW